MKIHYNTLTDQQIWKAAIKAGVIIERFDKSGSATHSAKVDIILSGSGKRAGFGATHQSATWDEWGIFLNALFEADSSIMAGPYTSISMFDIVTQYRFQDLNKENQHKRHGWNPNYDCSFSCECGADMYNSYHPAVIAQRKLDEERKVRLKAAKKQAKAAA